MKKSLLALCAMFVCSCAFATLQYKVANVEAHQRYPWNGKVDIDFTIESEDTTVDFKVTFECKDHGGNTNIVMKTIRNNDKGDAATSFTLKAGTYRFTWDADADVPNVKLQVVSFAVFANYLGPTETAEYLVIDLSGGTNATHYTVSTLSGVPSGGWTDEYKTTKLVLRRCPAGADPLGRYTLTKDFYAGVFEVTQKQWYQVMGNDEGWYSFSGQGDAYPAYSVQYDDIRGSAAGANWPSSSEVDADSFLGRLRSKTGLQELDLPTETQWEYACRAGTTTEYNIGDGETALANAGWYSGNANNTSHAVGLKTANAWGLYDMHGNVWEWCLGWEDESFPNFRSITGLCSRGGGWRKRASYATSSNRNNDYNLSSSGFRVFRTVP